MPEPTRLLTTAQAVYDELTSDPSYLKDREVKDSLTATCRPSSSSPPT